MSDPRKRAYEEEENEYIQSDEGKKQKKLIAEWNKRIAKVENLLVKDLRIKDLRFLSTVQEKYFPNDRVTESELAHLRSLTT